MKHFRLLCVCILAAMGLHATAQTATELAKEINRIKQSKNYLYAEVTMANEEEALAGAQDILEMRVNEWMATQKKGEDATAFIVQAKQHFTPIKTMRGQYHRAFVYVKKSDIVPISADGSTFIVEAAQSLTAPNSASQASAEELVQVVSVETIEPVQQAIVLTPEEQTLASIKQFSEIEGQVKALQDAGKLRAYGKYKDLPEGEGCYLLIYNTEGNVVAALRKEADGNQLNLGTLQEDDIQSYKGCGAIWLQLK